MCKFFSLISDGNGEVYYFNWKQRLGIMTNEAEFNKVESPDSHSSISSYYGFIGEKADQVNKYEYNPLTKAFVKDQINVTDDGCLVQDFCNKLDITTIIKPLIVKEIINPLTDIKAKKVTKIELRLCFAWASVRASVWGSVWDSVGGSVRASVGDSVWDSVWGSVGDSVGGYTSSFFNIKYKLDFSSNIKLWEKGFVPSFDGTKWRLHSGVKANIVWEGTIEELQKACK
jgi:hypothetical protein